MALLRVALLCQLFVSVAGAADKAEAILCLIEETEGEKQVELSFAGASATAFPEEIPQADALSVAQARPCCTTTWAGRVLTAAKIRMCQVARVRSKTTIARWKWVRWPQSTQSPRGSACLTVHLVARAQS